jgi:hypothetical protein
VDHRDAEGVECLRRPRDGVLVLDEGGCPGRSSAPGLHYPVGLERRGREFGTLGDGDGAGELVVEGPPGGAGGGARFEVVEASA